MSRRDFCVLGHACRLTDGTLILAGISTSHKLCPVYNNIIRGHMFGGYILQSMNNNINQTTVTYIGQVDLKGI